MNLDLNELDVIHNFEHINDDCLEFIIGSK
jgi:hypothetical protein